MGGERSDPSTPHEYPWADERVGGRVFLWGGRGEPSSDRVGWTGAQRPSTPQEDPSTHPFVNPPVRQPTRSSAQGSSCGVDGHCAPVHPTRSLLGSRPPHPVRPPHPSNDDELASVISGFINRRFSILIFNVNLSVVIGRRRGVGGVNNGSELGWGHGVSARVFILWGGRWV